MAAEIIWNTDTILFTGVLAIPITTLIGIFWYKLQRVKADNDLKRSMIDRGMSAAEIEQVLAAKSKE